MIHVSTLNSTGMTVTAPRNTKATRNLKIRLTIACRKRSGMAIRGNTSRSIGKVPVTAPSNPAMASKGHGGEMSRSHINAASVNIVGITQTLLVAATRAG